MSDKRPTDQRHPEQRATQEQHHTAAAEQRPADQRQAQAHRSADKRPTPDERRVAGTGLTPSREEMEQDHAARVDSINNPPQPSPTQAEADAMMEGTYEQPGAPPADDAAARERRQREEEQRQRDMRPQPGQPGYQTR